MKEEWHRRKKGLTKELKQSARQTKRPSNKKKIPKPVEKKSTAIGID